jgi:hypothetical protein
MNETIVIAGALAQKPRQGGHTWQFLQYLLGFRRLGWEVLFLDQIEPAMCVDDRGQPCPLEQSVNLRYLVEVMTGFGLQDDYSLIYNGGERFIGLTQPQVLERVRNSAFLLNFMGYLSNEAILSQAPRRVFLDTDPGFGQMWCDLGLADIFRGHDAYVTIGEKIGQPECAIPTCGLPWITMRQPVLLDEWPVQPGGTAFTSIGSWRGPYGPVVYGGKTYGLRVHEFRQFALLPGLSRHPFQVALDIHAAEQKDITLLDANGWALVDPKRVTRDPWVYRRYIQSSLAEFMVAKGMYVQANSGWFSERSICYLASGKPVLIQDTGLQGLYPLGEGLLTFRTLAEAQAGVAEITGNYARHACAARALAEEYFASDKVLQGLLTKLEIA